VDNHDVTDMASLGIEPVTGTPIQVRRSAQMGMFAALFVAQPETWPVFMAWLSEHAPAHARMARESGTGPKTFAAAADVLAGLDVGLQMLGVHED
jgi:hypothetical protein